MKNRREDKMDFKKIKEEAKEKCKDKLWDIWKPYIIIGVISVIIGTIAAKIFGADTIACEIVVMLFSMLLIPAEVGFTSYMLKLVRNQEYGLEELKAYYDKIGILILINILVTISILVGCILFIIPGIILAFSYTMVFYIFIDNKELKTNEYLEKSKEMMDGYKFNYFLFNLSFIGWILLCALIVPVIWVFPYITTANTLYYEELKKKQE